MSELLLGIDGGGSKTQLCIARRDGSIVHVAQAAGSNPHDNANWRDAFMALRPHIEPHLADIGSAVIAVGGYHESSIVDSEVDGFLRAAFPIAGLDIDNDVYVARDAAFPGRPGMLLIAGTGSMLVGRRSDGSLFRVGGWGVPIGDEGSAYWIGREAVSLATRMLDGRVERTAFADALFTSLVNEAHPTQPQIFEWLAQLSHHRSQIAELSRAVDALASAGHAEATALIEQTADFLAEHVFAGRRLAGSDDAGAWSLLGGMERSTTIRALLNARLGPIVDPAMPPGGGAIWRAARNLGWPTSDDWIDRISNGLGTHNRRASHSEMKDAQ